MAESRICEWCGLPIENPYGQQIFHTLKNGGRDCSREHHVMLQKVKRRREKGAVVRQCVIDGKIFKTYDHREWTCSPACAAEAERRQKGRKS